VTRATPDDVEALAPVALLTGSPREMVGKPRADGRATLRTAAESGAGHDEAGFRTARTGRVGSAGGGQGVAIGPGGVSRTAVGIVNAAGRARAFSIRPSTSSPRKAPPPLPFDLLPRPPRPTLRS
jgi:hypothetical protein